MNHEHPQFGDAYEQQVLGLEGEEETQAQLRQHLDARCPVCQEELARAQAAAVALGLLADPVKPSPAVARALRQRIARPRHAGSGKLFPPPFWIALAAAIVLAALTGFFYHRVTVGQQQQAQLEALLHAAQRQTRAALAGREQTEAALAILSSPSTHVVAVQLTPAHPWARAFVNRERGVVLMGEHLPTLPAGKTYEMWLLESHGSPQPAGIFAAAPSGGAIHLYAGPLHQAVGVAVSIEPAHGSAVPTGPIVLAAKFGATR